MFLNISQLEKKFDKEEFQEIGSMAAFRTDAEAREWPPRVILGRLLPHARGLGFKPRRGGFPSGAKKEWGLSPKANVRVLHTAQLDVTEIKVCQSLPLSNNPQQHDTQPTLNVQPTLEPINPPRNFDVEENNTGQATYAKFENKKDEDNTVIRNKARLVAKGNRKEEDKKHGMDKCDSNSTPMATSPKMDVDLSGTPVDKIRCQSMIGSLMHPTASRPDLVQAECTAMSMAEAEYVALSASCAQSAIAIFCNHVRSCTKHINVHYHFIKEQVEMGILELYFVRTKYQLADMFTKSLSKERFEYLVGRLDMRCLTPV
nr:retrotransposon protein, putative, unclassified [Tanacetum cinerariifolium]